MLEMLWSVMLVREVCGVECTFEEEARTGSGVDNFSDSLTASHLALIFASQEGTGAEFC